MTRPLIYHIAKRPCSVAIRYSGPKRHCQWWQLINNNGSSSSSASSLWSSSFSTSSSQSPKTPTKPASSWERSAKLVKKTDVTNPYLDRVRAEVVDPALQLKTIEDELCGAIGKALGRQGEKVLFAIREMKNEHSRYLECLRERSFEGAVRSARRHNDARERAIKVRWELLVHRQAVGFTVDNHSVVHKTFPITKPLPVEMEEIISMVSLDGDTTKLESDMPSSGGAADTTKKKVWGDQLDWWQRVGRWR